MDEFVEGGFWKGELYLDNGKKSYQALSLKSTGILGAVSMIFMNKDVKAAFQKYKNVPGNLKGDGLYAPRLLLHIILNLWLQNVTKILISVFPGPVASSLHTPIETPTNPLHWDEHVCMRKRIVTEAIMSACRQLGATFVFDKGGAMLLDYRQKDFGDHPSPETLLEVLGLDPSVLSTSSEEGGAAREGEESKK